MPTRGHRRARLRSARLINNYGARFWEITYTTEEAPGEERSTRLGQESVYDDPRPGDNVLITFLNGKPTAVYQTD